MKKSKKTQKGSALIYILIAIALLAALTATFMDSSSSQTSAQNAANLVAELGSQINFITSAIEECVLNYPGGDSTMPANPVGVQAEQPIRPYPLNAWNTYLASPAISTSIVKDIRCPGIPGNSNNHVKIFGGTSGKNFPPSNSLFGDWYYYNDRDGVFILIVSAKTDAFIATALQKLDTQFSKCESQYIDATGGPVQTTSNNHGGYTCAAGRRCFVVHIRDTATTIYPGETGCP